MSSIEIQWPDDADGDVLRRMKSSGFDFDQPCSIDFNVDFETSPPPRAATKILEQKYPSTKIYSSIDGGDYAQFQIHGRLTYDLVVSVQREISHQMAEFGGICESWGVLH